MFVTMGKSEESLKNLKTSLDPYLDLGAIHAKKYQSNDPVLKHARRIRLKYINILQCRRMRANSFRLNPANEKFTQKRHKEVYLKAVFRIRDI